MEPEPLKNKLKNKLQIMYEDDFDNPCWVYSKEDCDYREGRGKLYTHKFFLKRDIRKAVEYLKEKLGGECDEEINEAFEDVVK